MSDKFPFTDVIRKIKQSGPHGEMLNLLRFDWPVAEFVMERLNETFHEQMMEGVKDRSDGIIVRVISNALQSYDETVHFKKGTHTPDPKRLSVFLEALVTSMVEEIELELADEDGGRWGRGSALVLGNWLKSAIGESKLNQRDMKAYLGLRKTIYELITNEKVRNIMKGARHEKTILVGVLAAPN